MERKKTRPSKEIDAKAGPDGWVRSADEAYITARFLYHKGFTWPATWIGALAMELYAKAYLVKMGGTYRKGHDLTELFELCCQHTDFFRQFLENPNWAQMWPLYWDAMRYPEKVDKSWQGFTMVFGAGKGTLIDDLDAVSHFVRQEISIPKGTDDPLHNLLEREERPFRWSHSDAVYPNSEEIRALLVKDNRYLATEL